MKKVWNMKINEHFMKKHFTKGRSSKIQYLVMHHNASHGVDPYNIWQTREASAHFQVWEKKIPDNLVRIEDTAWHAQSANPISVGIEHENSKTGGDWPIADRTLERSARLVGYLCKYLKLGKPKLGKNIRMHSLFNATACPGSYFTRILQNPNHWYWQDALDWWKVANRRSKGNIKSANKLTAKIKARRICR